MIIDQQLHGYQHGHELLSGTVRLPARDQDLVDRLSDLAGPLTPGEKFAPYLTCYPLPSGSHYVLARTWQDREASRAGCVRTRSLLIPMADWLSSADPATLSAVVTEVGPTLPCKRLSVSASESRPLPAVDGAGIELLEALFLEDAPAVAVFGAITSETIALRILTAVWPAMRRRLTVSTFCNSPRTIAKRSFDLVFAPVDARPNFSDWKGRRIDGSRSGVPRHHWVSKITDAVFRAPRPTLSELDVFGEMAGDEQGTPQALRLSLLWNELFAKVDTEPHAALGLLDIANTRASRRADLVASLEPAFARAAQAAVANFPPSEAWRFLQLLITKLGNKRWRLSLARAIRSLVSRFAAGNPSEAIAAVPGLIREEGGDFLLSGIAQGLVDVDPFDPVARMLACLTGSDLLSIMLATPELLPMALASDAGVEGPLAESLPQVTEDQRLQAHRRMLPHLVADRHAELLRDCLARSSAEMIVSEADQLRRANGLGVAALNDVVVEAAWNAGAETAVRDVVLIADASAPTDAMMRALVRPTPSDVDWILDALDGAVERFSTMLHDVLNGASAAQLRLIFDSPLTASRIITALRRGSASSDLLARIAEGVPLQADVLLSLVAGILPGLSGRRGSILAAKCLDEALIRKPHPTHDNLLATFLDRSGAEMDVARVIRIGLSGVATSIIDRNLVLLDAAAPVTRKRVLAEPELLAKAVVAWRVLDISPPAAEAAARLLWDARSVNSRGYVRAAANLLPYVMEQSGPSASALLPAVFPPVYKELQQESLPDFLSIVFIFLDWDRCKLARRSLAQAALHSNWRARDVALAAARAGDVERILHTIVKRGGGGSFLASVRAEITLIPEPSKKQVWQAIKRIESDGGLKGMLPFDV